VNYYIEKDEQNLIWRIVRVLFLRFGDGHIRDARIRGAAERPREIHEKQRRLQKAFGQFTNVMREAKEKLSAGECKALEEENETTIAQGSG
jgi:hypothetical protein